MHCIERYQCDQYEYKIRKARINHEANEGKCHLAQYRTVPAEINNEIHDKKNEEETQQRSSFLQILMFQNHLMINDSCVRKEG